MSRKKGFTLIELLVVISIIALLLSILMPSLKRAKDQGKLVVCGSNQHQILLGLTTFMSGNDGKLPGSIQGTQESGSNTFWAMPVWLSYHSSNDSGSSIGLNGGSIGRQFAGYLDNPDVWFCPLSNYKNNYKGSSRSIEDRYKYGSGGPDNSWAWPNGALQSTNMLLWNYGGWQGKRQVIDDKIKTFDPAGNNRGDTQLLLAEYLFWGTFSTIDGMEGPLWRSTHPFKGAARSGGASGKSYWDKYDSTGEMPQFDYKLNAGYTDGSVRRYSAENASVVQTDRLEVYIPKDWK